jgi:hypothetical protein
MLGIMLRSLRGRLLRSEYLSVYHWAIAADFMCSARLAKIKQKEASVISKRAGRLGGM